MLGIAVLVVSLCVSARDAFAGAVDPRLAARLDARTAAEIETIIEPLRGEGLPTEPIVLMALEGASRRVPAGRIVEAVRRRVAALRVASAALGPASESELNAAGSVLVAGLPPDSLAALRRLHAGRSLVVPLVVLSDFLARGVSTETAYGSVASACLAGASDAELMRLRERVERDVVAGIPPASAAQVRTQSLVLDLESQGRAPASPSRRAMPRTPTGTGNRP
jgi:hypothetical protein